MDISVPYNTTEINLITPYMSNTTNVTLSPAVWSGAYATLMIQGNQATNLTNSTGATVAEWAILGENLTPLPVNMTARKREIDGSVRRMLRE